MARTFRVLILDQIGDVTFGPHYGPCGPTFGPSHESATSRRYSSPSFNLPVIRSLYQLGTSPIWEQLPSRTSSIKRTPLLNGCSNHSISPFQREGVSIADNFEKGRAAKIYYLCTILKLGRVRTSADVWTSTGRMARRI